MEFLTEVLIDHVQMLLKYVLNFVMAKNLSNAAQKLKFSIKDFFSKCEVNGFGHIYWRNLNGKLHFLCSNLVFM